MKKTFLLFTLCITCKWASAQSIAPATLNAAGGHGIAGNTEVDWSAGEMTLVNTTPAGSLIVTQGLLQPADNATGIANVQPLADKVAVFPNPASDVLHIRTDFQAAGKLSYMLTDVAGKVILQQNATLITGTQSQQLSLEHLAAGSYMLHVSYGNSDKLQETTYKIQKIK